MDERSRQRAPTQPILTKEEIVGRQVQERMIDEAAEMQEVLQLLVDTKKIKTPSRWEHTILRIVSRADNLLTRLNGVADRHKEVTDEQIEAILELTLDPGKCLTEKEYAEKIRAILNKEDE